jgi:hypothetical protein
MEVWVDLEFHGLCSIPQNLQHTNNHHHHPKIVITIILQTQSRPPLSFPLPQLYNHDTTMPAMIPIVVISSMMIPTKTTTIYQRS